MTRNCSVVIFLFYAILSKLNDLTYHLREWAQIAFDELLLGINRRCQARFTSTEHRCLSLGRKPVFKITLQRLVSTYMGEHCAPHKVSGAYIESSVKHTSQRKEKDIPILPGIRTQTLRHCSQRH
ncbi:hypothetical protein TNCV_3341311 [Trichonephila clavipes]|nr:hypothetical protein TNCV_3341311 [Trichonephila clavipes]